MNEARQRVPTAEYAQLQEQEKMAKEQLEAVKTQTPLAPDAPGMELMRQSAESRQKALDGLNPTQSFFLNTGMSIADSASTLPLAAVNPSLPLIAMGAKAAAGKTYELTQQGAGAGEAFGRGLVSGAIEAATEKIPLDELLGIMKHSAKGFKEFAKATLKQMGIEATEEGVSYIANYVADKAAKDPNAVFDIKELALSMAAGGLSGMVFGGAFGGYKAGVDNYNQVQAQKVAERQAVADYMAQGNAIRRDVGEVGIGANSRSVRPGIIFDIADNQVSSVNAYIERAAENRNGDEALLPYGYLQEEEAIELSALLGKDISGYRHAIRDNDIRHLLSNKDNSIDDLKQIPSIVKNADIKFLGKPTKPYADNPTLSGNQTIYYVKRHNGTTYYLEQVLDGEKVLATKQFKKIPTGTIPAFIHKLPLDEATKQTIVQKIKELSNPYHANVPTDVVPREHVQNEPIRELNNSFAPTIAKSQRDVNILPAPSTAEQSQTIPGTNITYTLDKQAGEPQIKFSKPIDEMTPVEFAQVLMMADRGELTEEQVADGSYTVSAPQNIRPQQAPINAEQTDIDAVQRHGYNDFVSHYTAMSKPTSGSMDNYTIPLRLWYNESEITPEEFERVVEMAERGELMAGTQRNIPAEGQAVVRNNESELYGGVTDAGYAGGTAQEVLWNGGQGIHPRGAGTDRRGGQGSGRVRTAPTGGQQEVPEGITRYTVSQTPQNLYSKSATEIEAILRSFGVQTHIVDEQSGKFEEMTPEEFERVVAMAERGELMANADDADAQPMKHQNVGLAPILVTPQAIDRVPYVESLYFEPNELRAMHQALLQEAIRFPLDIEVARSYTMDGQLLLQRVGEGGTVKLRQFYEPYFVIHNHPDTNILSMDDIKAIAGIPSLMGISAVGNNGNVFLLEKTSPCDMDSMTKACKEWETAFKQKPQTVQSATYELNKFLREVRQYGYKFISVIP